jgi:hypothetical protein
VRDGEADERLSGLFRPGRRAERGARKIRVNTPKGPVQVPQRRLLRLHLLAELTTTAFSVSGRYWVHHDGQGGRAALLEGFDEAIKAIPASLDLSAPE